MYLRFLVQLVSMEGGGRGFLFPVRTCHVKCFFCRPRGRFASVSGPCLVLEEVEGEETSHAVTEDTKEKTTVQNRK